MQSFTHETNGIRLTGLEAGPATGPLVILLHGFPEFSGAWEKQIQFLAQQGYHVLAPDQRGYNKSEKPKDVAAYHIDQLAADIAGLVRAAGYEKTFLVGHDWGGGVAWRTAFNYPELVEKLVVINCPYPAVMRKRMLGDWRQTLKSWYIFWFQIPVLPELGFRLGNKQFIASLRKTAQKDVFPEEKLKAYRDAWFQPGAARGMINWYRALLRNPPAGRVRPPRRLRPILPPTRILWGARDAFIGREAAVESLGVCQKGEIFFHEEASHWVIHEEPEWVHKHFLEFLIPK